MGGVGHHQRPGGPRLPGAGGRALRRRAARQGRRARQRQRRHRRQRGPLPHEPEDRDGFEDDDGCPEPDNDHDGIPDDDDECPDDAEEPGGDGDGCPDKARVTVRNGKLVIFGKIQFASGRTPILPKSEQLVDEMARALKEHPELKKVEIQGHTDSTGDDFYNLKLGQERAESVKRALVKRGVAPVRLMPKGYGEGNPIAPNDTPRRQGQEPARRVHDRELRRGGDHAQTSLPESCCRWRRCPRRRRAARPSPRRSRRSTASAAS